MLSNANRELPTLCGDHHRDIWSNVWAILVFSSSFSYYCVNTHTRILRPSYSYKSHTPHKAHTAYPKPTCTSKGLPAHEQGTVIPSSSLNQSGPSLLPLHSPHPREHTTPLRARPPLPTASRITAVGPQLKPAGPTCRPLVCSLCGRDRPLEGRRRSAR